MKTVEEQKAQYEYERGRLEERARIATMTRRFVLEIVKEPEDPAVPLPKAPKIRPTGLSFTQAAEAYRKKKTQQDETLQRFKADTDNSKLRILAQVHTDAADSAAHTLAMIASRVALDGSPAGHTPPTEIKARAAAEVRKLAAEVKVDIALRPLGGCEIRNTVRDMLYGLAELVQYNVRSNILVEAMRNLASKDGP